MYSGRRDPTWVVTDAQARELLALLSAAPVIKRWPPPRAILGYRGCWLESPQAERWLAYDGVIVNAPLGWMDDAHRFERAILATAPTDLLPPGARI